MRCAFIAGEKARYLMALLCRVLHVSRSGLWASQERPAGPANSTGPKPGAGTEERDFLCRYPVFSPRRMLEQTARTVARREHAVREPSAFTAIQ